MADGTGAAALFPGLPSGAPPEARPAPADGGSVYGPGPNAGIDRAREMMAAGVAGAQPAEPGKPAPTDWLGDALKGREDGAAKEAPERAPAAANAGNLDIAKLGLDPNIPITGEFSRTAAEIGLDQAAAAKLVPLHERAMTAASTEFWDKQTADWEKASRSQFGPRLDSVVSQIKPLLSDNRLTTPGFRALLDQYRLGNNPDVIRTLSNWAQAMRRGR